MPKASLIISVYNNIPFLEVVLRSVNEQTWNDFEIIISEDGEHKEMRDFIKAFPFKHPWIHLQQEDIGWRKNKALNKAIMEAHSEYLVFVDGDCVLHPRFMESHARMAKEGCILGGKRLKLNDSLSNEFMKGNRTYRNIGFYLLKNLLRISKLGIRFPEEAFVISPESILMSLPWIRKKKCNTKLVQTAANEPIFDLIDRAENWLATHTWNIPLYKWETSSWGEIPADFGRK